MRGKNDHYQVLDKTSWVGWVRWR